jgi:cystathionine beta-lyase/cystathionine gamma-synthase
MYLLSSKSCIVQGEIPKLAFANRKMSNFSGMLAVKIRTKIEKNAKKCDFLKFLKFSVKMITKIEEIPVTC